MSKYQNIPGPNMGEPEIPQHDEHEEDIVDALHQDLSKPKLESIVYEVRKILGIARIFFLKKILIRPFFWLYDI
jgi:hypothetical protein